MIYDSDFFTMLSKESRLDVSIEQDFCNGQPILFATVDTPTALTYVIAEWREQAAGKRTFFRGQSKLYDLLPEAGAYRSEDCKKNFDKFFDLLFRMPSIRNFISDRNLGNEEVKVKLEALGSEDFAVSEFGISGKDLPVYAMEGLMQQYVGNTRWIDVVDNVQIALWMATRTYRDLHSSDTAFPKKAVAPLYGSGISGASPKHPSYVYLYMFAFDCASSSLDGLYQGEAAGAEAQLLDLREVMPSRFLRPHAQHAMLLKAKPTVEDAISVAVLRVPIEAARDFIGSSTLLSVESIFPGVLVDAGIDSIRGIFQAYFGPSAKRIDQMGSEFYPCEYVASVEAENYRAALGPTS